MEKTFIQSTGFVSLMEEWNIEVIIAITMIWFVAGASFSFHRLLLWVKCLFLCTNEPERWLKARWKLHSEIDSYFENCKFIFVAVIHVELFLKLCGSFVNETFVFKSRVSRKILCLELADVAADSSFNFRSIKAYLFSNTDTGTNTVHSVYQISYHFFVSVKRTISNNAIISFPTIYRRAEAIVMSYELKLKLHWTVGPADLALALMFGSWSSVNLGFGNLKERLMWINRPAVWIAVFALIVWFLFFLWNKISFVEASAARRRLDFKLSLFIPALYKRNVSLSITKRATACLRSDTQARNSFRSITNPKQLTVVRRLSEEPNCATDDLKT